MLDRDDNQQKCELLISKISTLRADPNIGSAQSTSTHRDIDSSCHEASLNVPQALEYQRYESRSEQHGCGLVRSAVSSTSTQNFSLKPPSDPWPQRLSAGRAIALADKRTRSTKCSREACCPSNSVTVIRKLSHRVLVQALSTITAHTPLKTAWAARTSNIVKYPNPWR